MNRTLTDLPIEVFLLILEQDIYVDEFKSLRLTCKKLWDIVTPVIWPKLELCYRSNHKNL